MNVAALQRKLLRLQDQAQRSLLARSQIVITTCWGDEDQDERQPGVTYIKTEWSSPALAREDRGNQDQGE